MDIIITTFAIYYTGKSSSPLVFLYFLIVLSSIFDVLIEYVYYYLIVIIGVCYMTLYLVTTGGRIFTPDIYIYLAQFGLLAFVGYTGNLAAKRMAGHYDEIKNINTEKEHLLETVKKANFDLEEKVKGATASLANTNLVLVKKNISLLAVHEIYKTADDAHAREELLNMALGIIVPLMKGTGGIILSTVSGRSNVRVEVYKNIIGQDAVSGKYEWTISQDSVFNDILKKKRTMFFRETSGEKDPILKEIIKDGSCIAAPLVSEGKTSGLIIVFSKEASVYNKNDLELIEILGEQIGVLLHNRLMFEDMRSKADGLEKLMKLTLNIGSSLNMNEIIRNSLTESIRKLFLSSAGVVMLVDERNALRIRAQYGLNEDIINSQVPDNSIAGWVYKNNRNLFIKDSAKLRFYNPDADNVYLKKVAIISPIYQKGKVMGVICVAKSKGEYKRDDLYLLTVLGSHIGGSIEIVNLYEDVKKDYINTVYALAAAVDAKDHYTHGHSTTVMKYSTKMAEAMKLPAEEIENIKYAGLLHDIGKIGISENIINKPAKLTKEEYAVVKMHPQMGANIISKIDALKKLAPLVVGHHEWVNGSGYPSGLRGDEIPLGARIISIADAYSTMTSNRPYRAAMGMQESIKELEKFGGTQFDAKIVSIFATILRNEEKEDKAKKETPAVEDKKDKKRLRVTLEGDVNNPDIVSRDEKFYS
jgi:putative nucleotidyltransferase with HDIG domain